MSKWKSFNDELPPEGECDLFLKENKQLVKDYLMID